MRLVLLGPPGAGKGTQAAAVRDRLGVPHISTGEMLRGVIASGTPTGLKAKTIVEGGNLVPDDVMAEMVQERLSQADSAGGFLLDGYPRNVEQGRTLRGILSKMNVMLDGAIYLALADDEIVRRLSGRRTCSACGSTFHVESAVPHKAGICDACGGALVIRPDDKSDVVEQRLKVYRDRTAPLVEFYRSDGILMEIPAEGILSEVERRVLAAVSMKTGPGQISPSKVGSARS